MDHVIDKACSCEFCTMLNAMWGDPLLSDWETSFVDSVARWGWLYEYTPNQKAKIREVFKIILNRRGIIRYVPF